MTDWTATGKLFHHVVMVPYSDLLDRWRDGEIHRGGPIWPEWEAQESSRHNRGGRPVDVRPVEPDGPIAESGPMAWGGAIVDAFGHQVADFSARVLATVQARPDLPVAFASRPDLGYDEAGPPPAYFAAILDWFGVPADRVRVITAPTRAQELFVAPQAEQLGGPGPDAGYLDALGGLTDIRLGPVVREHGLLYVSRAGMEARFAGEPYLEDRLRAAGVTVVRPETLPLPEQLRRYRAATNVVFAEGSALHALQLMGRIDADVGVLERRPGTRLAEANLRPRLRGLVYEEVAATLVHGVWPTGRPALPKGLALADPDRLLDAFIRRGVDLAPTWDPVAWATARDADILGWAEQQASARDQLGTGSAEHILDGLTEAGLGHLVDQARTRLRPLQERSGTPSRLRTPGHPTLLFMHLPRTAGGAVRAALHAAVPEPERRDVYAGTELDVAAFTALPAAERSGLTAVIGDFAFGLHEAIPGEARYAVMLRHPIARILSLYRAAGKPGSFESWVFDDHRLAADNAMVRAISGRPDVPFGACSEDMLDEALAHIEARFDAVLIRSNMRRSAVLLGQATGFALPSLPVVNADPAGEASFEPSKPARKRLRELNRFDLALFKRFAEGF